MTLFTTATAILSRWDAGEHPTSIAAAVGVTVGHVYGVLREHRPDRDRVPRPCTSAIPHKIRALLASDIKPSRVAKLLGVTRQYVSKVKGSVQ